MVGLYIWCNKWSDYKYGPRNGGIINIVVYDFSFCTVRCKLKTGSRQESNPIPLWHNLFPYIQTLPVKRPALARPRNAQNCAFAIFN